MTRSIALVALVVLSGCGDRAATHSATVAPTRLPLLQGARARGEVLLHATSSPVESGPYAFSGRYRVRFEQTAPENAHLDFAKETPFVVELHPPSGPGRSIDVFHAAAKTGSRTLEIDGRWTVGVEYGDFPYAVRFTPVH